jgi:hypothetical protein
MKNQSGSSNKQKGQMEPSQNNLKKYVSNILVSGKRKIKETENSRTWHMLWKVIM